MVEDYTQNNSDIIRVGSYLEKILENEEGNRTYVFYFYGETMEGEARYLTRTTAGHELGDYPDETTLKAIMQDMRERLKRDIANAQSHEDMMGEENSEFTDVKD